MFLRTRPRLITLLALCLAFPPLLVDSCLADWRVMTAGDERQSRPPKKFDNATPIKPGDRWPTDNKFRWLIGDRDL
ncbi:MAG: hypothetical protein IPK15_23605 [Verrucomicrobia bacterium]|nr:hypothetical protein [Verrucomicrobiota bacterium]